MTVKLIVTHIPKTGGVTLHRMLLPHFRGILNPWDKINVRFESTRGQQLLERPGQLRALLAPALRGIHAEVLMGHMPQFILDGLFPDAKRITWLRNPIDRVVSAYYHWRRMGYIPRRETLMDFAHRPTQRNQQHYYTSGDLSRFDFVGVLEYESFANLAAFLGIDYTPPGHLNAGNYAFPDRDMRARIYELNTLDWEVYDAAASRQRRES